MKHLKHLVLGGGEVGKAIFKILCGKFKPTMSDKVEEISDTFDYIHICFPYNSEFVAEVKRYIKLFSPKLVIIHSSVPIGTTRQLGKLCVHSPIRGVHPYLEKGIRTFVKYFGGVDKKRVKQASTLFRSLKIRVSISDKPEDSEAAKLLCTTYYAWSIMFEKWVKEFCDKHKLNFFDVYTHFNFTYNEGYTKLGMSHVVRPIIRHMEGKIGGHCQIENSRLLPDFEPARIILKKNKTL